MNKQDQLEELLVDWELQRRQGNELSVDELCNGNPEFVPEMSKLIIDLKSMDWLEDDDDSDDDFLHLPDFNTVSGHADETRLPECSLTVEEFCQRLIESRLMDEEKVGQLKQRIDASDGRSLAVELVSDKKLTRFQATVLLEGRDIPLVLDRYVLLGEIGAGGMGAVYKALHQQMDRVVALKILPKESVDSPDKVKRFQREVRAAAKLEHGNVVTAFDAREDKGFHFLVMSYVKGSDLAETVRKHGPVSAAKAVNYITQAACGLEHAHNMGIIHRDIKPGNLLLNKKGKVQILDMGLARIENGDAEYDKTVTHELTQAGMVMGTIAYLAPEQALDSRHADARSDIYSLGCTLYYLLTGKALFIEDTMMKTIMAHSQSDIPSLCEERESVPVELDAIFQKMVAKQPKDRFQNMTEVISALEELEIEDDEESQPVVAVPPAMHETATFIDTSRNVIEPQPLQQMRAGGSTKLKLLLLTTVAALILLAGIIYRIQTNNGTIIVELADKSIAAKLTTSGVIIEDGDRKWTINIGDSDTLPTGETYSARLPKDSGLMLTVTDDNGTELDTSKFQIRRNGKILVKVTASATALTQRRTSAAAGENWALKFDGKESWVELPKLMEARPATTPITIEIAVNWTGESNAPILRLGPFALRQRAGLSDYLVNATQVKSVSVNSDKERIPDRTNYLCGVFDGRDIRFYLNGERQSHNVFVNGQRASDKDSVDVIPDYTVSNYGLGVDVIQSSDFHGIIDEVRISNIARYTEDFTPEKRFTTDKNTLALYHFDTGTGDVLKDSSGNGHHGKIVGAKWVRVDDELKVIEPEPLLATTTDPHRRAAEMVLRRGGNVQVLTSTRAISAKEIHELPKERFAINAVDFTGADPLSDDEWKTFEDIESITYFHSSGVSISEEGTKQIGRFTSLLLLGLDKSNLTDAALSHLAELTNLRELKIRGNADITDASAETLGKLVGLRDLRLSSTGITNNGLTRVAALPNLYLFDISLNSGNTRTGVKQLSLSNSLRHLSLWHRGVSDDAIQELGELTRLNCIELFLTSVSDEGAARLQTLLPNCSVVHPSLPTPVADLAAAQWVVDQGGFVGVHGKLGQFRELPDELLAIRIINVIKSNTTLTGAENLRGLRSCEILLIPRLENADEEMKHIATLKSLRQLDIGRSDVSGIGLEQLNGLSQLEELGIGVCKNITDADLAHVFDFTHLWNLNLGRSQIAGDGLKHVGKIRRLQKLALELNPNLSDDALGHLTTLSQLRNLNLHATPITDAAIEHLQQIQSLRILNITQTKITAAGAAKIQAALPDCVVFHESLEDVPWQARKIEPTPLATTTDPHRRAAEMVLRRGGSVVVITSKKTISATISAKEIHELPKERFAISGVDLTGADPLSDADWKAFRGVKHIKNFNHSGKPVSAAGIAEVKEIGSCLSVNLGNCDFDDGMVKQLSGLTDLGMLIIFNNTGITSASCNDLAKLESLRELHINGTRIDGSGLKVLSALPNLRSLTLDLDHGITPSDLTELRSMKSLRSLALSYGGVNDDVIGELGMLTDLRVIGLFNTGVSDEGAARLQKLLPLCSVIHPSLPTSEADIKTAKWAVDNGASMGVHWRNSSFQVMPKEPFTLKHLLLLNSEGPLKGSSNLDGLRSLESVAWPGLENTDEELASIGKLTTLRMLSLSRGDVSGLGLEQLNGLSQLEELELGSCKNVSDDALAHLADFKHLRLLNLSQTPTTDDGLKYIGKLRSLRYLSLGRNLNGTGLSHLISLPLLRQLGLQFSSITDEAVPHLQQMKSLRILNISGIKITAEGAAKIQAALPDCVVFHESLEDVPWGSAKATLLDTERAVAEWVIGMGGKSGLNGKGKQKFALLADLPQEGRLSVSSVDLDLVTSIGDDDLEMLQGLLSLRFLKLRGRSVTSEALKDIVRHKALVGLYIISSGVSDDGLDLLNSLPKLSVLFLSDSKISDGGLGHIAKCSELAYLDLFGNATISDKGILSLKPLTKLKSLELGGTKVTAKGVAELQKHLPDCTIYWDGNKAPTTADPLTGEKTTHIWPKDQPAPAIAPFNAEQAKQYQESWAKHLGVEVETTNSIGMKFRVIPPGEFLMGTSDEDIEKLLAEAKEQKFDDSYTERIWTESPQHRVTLTKPFTLAIHEVTRGQFRQFVDKTGYKSDAEKDGKGGNGWKDGKWVEAPEFLWNTNLGFETEQTDDHPVVNVSWNDAVAFCEWLSKKEGVTYRLPTEAEWEFVCRAGSLARFSFGNDDSKLGEFAWYGLQGGRNTMPVGKKAANALGLFDLHGNVWEWCDDKFGPYAARSSVDPLGSKEETRRLLRGGSFSGGSSLVHSAYRHTVQPFYRSHDVGFRIVRTLEKTAPTQPKDAPALKPEQKAVTPDSN